MKSAFGLCRVGVVAFVLGACGTHAAPNAPAAEILGAATCSRGRAFVVVRHAEKASTDKDTSLSDRGRARAKVLASMFATTGVTRLVATQYKRTQETLAPLAERVGLPVEVRPADRTNELVSELRGAPDGALVVVATHSNVVPLVVRELGASELPGVVDGTLPENEFSRVVLITQPCGAKRPFILELGSDG